VKPLSETDLLIMSACTGIPPYAAAEIRALRAQLAAVTAERDAARGLLDAPDRPGSDVRVDELLRLSRSTWLHEQLAESCISLRKERDEARQDAAIARGLPTDFSSAAPQRRQTHAKLSLALTAAEKRIGELEVREAQLKRGLHEALDFVAVLRNRGATLVHGSEVAIEPRLRALLNPTAPKEPTCAT
jgi:hypothetical protein